MLKKYHAHHVTGICLTPGDDEQTTVGVITDKSESEFLADGCPGNSFAFVPIDEDGGEAMAKRIAAALNFCAGISTESLEQIKPNPDLNILIDNVYHDAGQGRKVQSDLVESLARLIAAKLEAYERQQKALSDIHWALHQLPEVTHQKGRVNYAAAVAKEAMQEPDLSVFKIIQGPEVVRPINAAGGLYMLVEHPVDRKISGYFGELKGLAKKNGFRPSGDTTVGFPSKIGLDRVTTAVWFHDKG